MSWLTDALKASNKPKESIIGVLKRHLGGQQPGRDRSVVHASDITSADFCPRREAFFDLQEKKAGPEYLSTALDVTFQLGLLTEKLLMEQWAGEYAIGNWECDLCGDYRYLTKKPEGHCKESQGHTKHRWRYQHFLIEAPEYGVQGSPDGFFNVGAPRLLLAEIKIITPEEFEKMLVPLPEHRVRTSLYLKLIADSNHPYKDKFNLTEARVLYVSRGHGKKNPEWAGEILPFREFKIVRDDAVVKPQLQKAKALKLFREGDGIPNGICSTALDKYAKSCSACKLCFSGQYQAKVQWQTL